MTDIQNKMHNAGLIIGHHESDLYVKDCPAAWAVLEDYGFKSTVIRFTSETGEGPCLEIPSAYSARRADQLERMHRIGADFRNLEARLRAAGATAMEASKALIRFGEALTFPAFHLRIVHKRRARKLAKRGETVEHLGNGLYGWTPGVDYYKELASATLGLPVAEVHPQVRNRIKRDMYLFNYGVRGNIK